MKKVNRPLIAFVLAIMVGTGFLTKIDLDTSLALIADPINWIIGLVIFFLFLTFKATFDALEAMKFLIKGAEHPQEEEEEEEEEEKDWLDNLLHKLTDATPVDKEEEVATDHVYDGIRELDNNLPPWWIAGFYISIGIAVIYLLRYHVFESAPLSQEELKIELAEAEVAREAYLKNAANLVDESNVVLLTEESRLMAGAKIFSANCAVCHANDGGGGVGPNLTDSYWLHGNSIKDIFRVIKYGVPAKGMIPWKDQLNPTKMQEVSSYILSLTGTVPANPKEAQGDLFTMEETDSSGTSNLEMLNDSTAVQGQEEMAKASQ
jgi:cytochrome c oxidase cbb3-type subunit 3